MVFSLFLFFGNYCAADPAFVSEDGAAVVVVGAAVVVVGAAVVGASVVVSLLLSVVDVVEADDDAFSVVVAVVPPSALPLPDNSLSPESPS